MSKEADEQIADLQRRVEALEAAVMLLKGRVEDLEAGQGGPSPIFHMADETPTV